MNKNKTKITIEIDRHTFEPATKVPYWKHHSLLFQLGLLLFGDAQAAGKRLSDKLKQEVTERLKAIRHSKLDDLAWDSTLLRAVDDAYSATRAGRNNLFRHHSQTDGDRFALRV